MAYDGLSPHIDFNKLPDPGDRFQLKDVIGEGTYGEVYSAFDKLADKWVAIKVLENIPDNLEEIEEEYLILKNLCLHPNIPIFYGLYLKRAARADDDQLWFAMELCTGGSVTDLVQGIRKREAIMPEHQIAYILKETMEALLYLHNNHCMHRDIKGHNILLTEEAHVKLVDFGVSSHLAATMGRRNTSVGTPYWMAPEVIACEQQLDYSYDVRCDVWSVGITGIELADGDPPLSDVHPMRALFQIPRNPPPTLKNPEDWSKDFVDFISECLIKDFEQRPIIKELIQHPFIKQLPQNLDPIRRELKEELRLQRTQQQLKRAPEVTTKHGKLKSNRKSKHQPIYVDDLASLENLTEDIIVEQLYRRFIQGQIYTYIGDILIAVNPFQDLGIYTENHSNKYRSQARSDSSPHIFAIADSSYHAMLHHKQNQCIVISGESGAGKTESANFLLRQLVSLGKAPNRNLEDKILQVNPIMEAFGNAKTGINDNSSRFGKFLELTFTALGKVTGAKVSVYLLEQSRVVFQAIGEHNFHIFYYLYDGLEARNRLHDYHLDRERRFTHRYLRGYSSDEVSVKHNCQKFQNVLEGFNLLGFTGEEVDTVCRILAAILNLGDVDFVGGEAADNTDNSIIGNHDILSKVASLLGVIAQDLEEALTTNSVVTRGEIIQRNNTEHEAASTRDAMAKALYGRLFDWLVNRINKLLSFGRLVYGDSMGVSLLDIFGFENFQKNSFEQLCINIANEQIQYYFNQHIFTWEQQEYMSEGVSVDLIEFSDNRPVLDMFLSKPMGILALLDEESRFPKASDQSLIDKFHNNIRSRYYHKPKSNDLNFTIEHYAGKVAYDVENFLEKNRNFLPPEVIQLLRQSNFDIIRTQFQSPLTRTGNLYQATPRSSPRATPNHTLDGALFGSTKVNTQGLASQTRAQQTVATYFRFSLMDLLQKMVNGHPHFVRCIKPNDEKSACYFNRHKVALQLQYTGVLETIHIRQQGFSHRIPFAEFLKRYCFLAFGFDERVVASRENCRLLLIRLKMDGWVLGKTKVFLKYYHVEYLSRMYEQQVRKIILVQACVRRWLARIRFKKEKWQVARSVLTMQKFARGWLARRRLAELKKLQEEVKEEQHKSPSPTERNSEYSGRSTPTISAVASPSKKQGQKRRAPSPPKSKPPSNENDITQDAAIAFKEEDAALLIQRHYRGHLVRLEIGPILEEKLKERQISAMNPTTNNNNENTNTLSKDQAASILQKYFRKWRASRSIFQQLQKYKAQKASQLIIFSQQVHQNNQEAHKNLRKNKYAINLNIIHPPNDKYKKPKGFDFANKYFYNGEGIPNMVPRAQLKRPDFKVIMGKETAVYYDELQKSGATSPDFTTDDPWDAPLKKVEAKIFSEKLNQERILNIQDYRQELVKGGLKSQLQINKEREAQLAGKWKGVVSQEQKRASSQNQNTPGRGPSNINKWQKNNDHRGPTRDEGSPRNGMEAKPRHGKRGPAPNPPGELQRHLRKPPIGGNEANGNSHLASGGAFRSFEVKETTDDHIGPYDFRKMLRKTNNAPTESLRRRKGLPTSASAEFPWEQNEQRVTSPNNNDRKLPFRGAAPKSNPVRHSYNL